MRTRQAARRETKKASAVFRYVLRDEFEKVPIFAIFTQKDELRLLDGGYSGGHLQGK